MAIAFRNGNEDNAFVTGTFSVSEPTGTAQNDIIIYLSLIDHGNTLTPPSGWTTLFSGPMVGGFTDYVLAWQLRGSSAANLTWTGSNAYTHDIYVLSFSGAEPSLPPIATQTTPDTGMNPDPPAIGVTVAGSMVLAIGYNATGASPWTPPTGYTLQTNGINGVTATKVVSTIGTENPGAFGGVSVGDARWSASVSIKPSLAVTSAPLQWISGG